MIVLLSIPREIALENVVCHLNLLYIINLLV